MNNNIKIYVLFCDDAIRDNLPSLNNCYEKVDLRELWEKTGHRYNGDGDFFRSEICVEEEYIGVISGRYNMKEPRHAVSLENLYTLPLQKDMIWTPYLISDDWYSRSIRYHPGMEIYLNELVVTYKKIKLIGPVVYTQSFIASVEVFKDWQKFWIRWFNKWDENKPMNYYHFPQHALQWSGALMERVTTAYFTLRDDLIIKQIP